MSTTTPSEGRHINELSVDETSRNGEALRTSWKRSGVSCCGHHLKPLQNVFYLESFGARDDDAEDMGWTEAS